MGRKLRSFRRATPARPCGGGERDSQQRMLSKRRSCRTVSLGLRPGHLISIGNPNPDIEVDASSREAAFGCMCIYETRLVAGEITLNCDERSWLQCQHGPSGRWR